MQALSLGKGRNKMGQKIKDFLDGSYLEYDRGSFDDWCVYLTKPNGSRKPPRDVDYFQKLKDYATRYGVETIYNDYVKVYDLTGKKLEPIALQEISNIASSYEDDALELDIIFSILYMAMIAEENKANTRLGKRIKRLGIYKLLIENCSVQSSANFMRGMGWRDIDTLCKERGF